ncbi:MAG: PIG-L family deacetylase, partial [Planctomycetota bacterium]|jgi:glucosamine-6-phosphate deaminase
VTRKDAASDFFGETHVPRRAITMGVGTILKARRIVLLALGEQKASVIARAVEGPVCASVAASFLQEHPNAAVYLDRAAAAELTRLKSPWVLGPIDWDEPAMRSAAIWLAGVTDKPVLKLTDEDYNENGLQDLLAEQPHPDDDVISMGGTLMRLGDQGHDVHVAYQTSGNIAVFDDDATRFADFATAFNRGFGIDDDQSARLEHHIEASLKNKTPGQADSAEVRRIKSLIRRGEARAAGRWCGVSPEHLHFLDLPFYETGRVHKRSLSDKDVEIIVGLLRDIRPQQVYAAGDLSDPHGTHRTCLTAIHRALECVSDEPWYADCEVWLYRGAWQEWEPQEIDMAVPLSPQELRRKIEAIFKHESQKDKALFPGPDEREFWQRAEQRNRETARIYDRLGLAEYEAMEAFVRWRG